MQASRDDDPTSLDAESRGKQFDDGIIGLPAISWCADTDLEPIPEWPGDGISSSPWYRLDTQEYGVTLGFQTGRHVSSLASGPEQRAWR